jgi:hypothetical protein
MAETRDPLCVWQTYRNLSHLSGRKFTSSAGRNARHPASAAHAAIIEK